MIQDNKSRRNEKAVWISSNHRSTTKGNPKHDYRSDKGFFYKKASVNNDTIPPHISKYKKSNLC